MCDMLDLRGAGRLGGCYGLCRVREWAVKAGAPGTIVPERLTDCNGPWRDLLIWFVASSFLPPPTSHFPSAIPFIPQSQNWPARSRVSRVPTPPKWPKSQARRDPMCFRSRYSSFTAPQVFDAAISLTIILDSTQKSCFLIFLNPSCVPR